MSLAAYNGCMSIQPAPVAVLTGDLVASTALTPDQLSRAMDALAQCAGAQAAWHGAPLRFARHRGDGWQVALARPALCLRGALAFRAALRALGDGFDSYISIATGDAVQTTADSLNALNDPVFVASGRGLDALKQAAPQRIAHADGGAPRAATILADHISQGWTPPQAAAILPMLDPDTPTVTAIADSLGKSRQAVTKSLHAAGWPALSPALLAFEDAPHG